MPWNGVITNSGSKLLEEWTSGKTLTITGAKTASGTVETAALLAQTDLSGSKFDASIVQQKQIDKGIQLKIQVTAAQTAYTLHQIGVWARIDTEQPVLFALFQHEQGQNIPSSAESADFAYSVFGVLAVSNTGELSVQIDASALVTRSTMQDAIDAATDAVQANLDRHTADESNPHNVTASQVGLGNVPNVATNDQTPTYTQSSALTALSSGEKLSAAFGKIAKAVADLISHIASKSNPHSVTAAQVGARPATWTPTASDVGAAPASHTHNAAQAGLGNVPNVATNDQTPTYTQSSALTALSSGEKLSIAFGKIAKAVADLISHIANKSNPHSVTAAQVGARPSTWTPTAADVGAVPTSRTVNGKALSGNISLTASDVGASASGHTHSYLPLAGGTLTGNLTLKNNTNFGCKINLGDGDYVHIAEPADDTLELKGSRISLVGTLQLNGNQFITASTGDLTSGSSSLATGCLYFVYE